MGVLWSSCTGQRTTSRCPFHPFIMWIPETELGHQSVPGKIPFPVHLSHWTLDNSYKLKLDKITSLASCLLREWNSFGELHTLYLFHFFKMYKCFATGIFVYCVCGWYPLRPGESIRSPGTGATDG